MAASGSSAALIKDSTFDITEREKDIIDKAFSRLDRNGDRRISRDELKAGMIHLGETPTKARLEELFGSIDVNANGYIDQDEFKTMMAERFIEDRLKKTYTHIAFKMLDKNNDGFITPEEINQVVNDVGLDLPSGGMAEMLRDADTNNDGKINYKVIDKAFSRLDRNGDGRISRDELKAGMIHLGETPTKARLEELFGSIDLDANGYISQDEFKTMMAERFIEDRLKKTYTHIAFKMLDKNNDGFITPEEINQVVNDVGLDLPSGGVAEMLREADTNNDGKINYKEFSKALWRRTSSNNLNPSSS
ncbi:calmodulin, flagellar-like [Liolophura sinensis]|uniref:calmodulin, flagellar-like n=1 Tax=Liolophura sinensis TaxID=3198878 RepID=UPI00315989C8